MHRFISLKNKIEADEYHYRKQSFQPKTFKPPTETAGFAWYLEWAAGWTTKNKKWFFCH